MSILYLICTVTIVVVLVYSIVMAFKNNNTYKNHKIIADAIYKYHMAVIKNTNPLAQFDFKVDYSDMESYAKTYFRIWDWGYKSILPPDKFEIIKEYIDIPPEKDTTEFYKNVWLGIFMFLFALSVMSSIANQSRAEYEPVEEPTIQENIEVEPEPEILPEPEPEPQPSIEDIYGESIIYLAKTVYGEARGCSLEQQAAVIWCILNRVDAGYSKTGNVQRDIINVITQPNAFHGYISSHPVRDDIRQLVVDVLERYEREKAGEINVGRILPKEYLWFGSAGNNTNRFRDAYTNGHIWDWSLESPYKYYGEM